MIKKHTQAVAYTRVSTRRQGADGIGLDGQRAAIDHCARHTGIEIVDWFSDAASGRGKDNLARRPGVKAALDLAASRGIPIIVSGLSRLSRDVETLEAIMRDGIKIISATEGSLDPVTFGSIAARAQAEGELISRRTREGMAASKERGVKFGNPNLPDAQRKGAARNKERSLEKVQEIAALLANRPDWKTMSVADAVAFLDREGVRTNRNQEWTVAALRRPLRMARELLRSREEEMHQQHPYFGRF